MKAYDLAELAVRNLRESVLRNSLTTVGISVGVASLVAMLSLGIGLQQLATKRLVKSGLFDTVVVTSGATCATSIVRKTGWTNSCRKPGTGRAVATKDRAASECDRDLPGPALHYVLQFRG